MMAGSSLSILKKGLFISNNALFTKMDETDVNLASLAIGTV